MAAPLTRILVATDGSPPAQRALRWAGGVAAATNAFVEAVYAWWPDQSELPPDIARQEEQRAQTKLSDSCQPLREAGVAHEGRAIEGDPRQVLPREAQRTGPDLVVVGARRPGGFGLGAVTHHLAHLLQVPLAVVPDSDFGAGPLVVGVDGSDANRSALRWAAALAVQLGRTAEAVYAAAPILSSTGATNPARWRWTGEDEVRAEMDEIQAEHGHIKLVFVADRPAPGLAEVAVRADAEAVVVGTRGRRGLHGLILGKVPVELIHGGARPVIIVPHDR